MLSVASCVEEGTTVGESVLAATSTVVEGGIVNEDDGSGVVSLDGVAICVADWSPHALATVTATTTAATRRTLTVCAR